MFDFSNFASTAINSVDEVNDYFNIFYKFVSIIIAFTLIWKRTAFIFPEKNNFLSNKIDFF